MWSVKARKYNYEEKKEKLLLKKKKKERKRQCEMQL